MTWRDFVIIGYLVLLLIIAAPTGLGKFSGWWFGLLLIIYSYIPYEIGVWVANRKDKTRKKLKKGI